MNEALQKLQETEIILDFLLVVTSVCAAKLFTMEEIDYLIEIERSRIEPRGLNTIVVETIINRLERSLKTVKQKLDEN